MSSQLNSIEEAIEDIKAGKVVIVVDDEDRENEGDFVAAGEMTTPELINFMVTHGRGLVCTPISQDLCEKLDLHLMVGKNTDPHETAFTVSIDLNGKGVTTGISAGDRAKTIQALIDPETKPEDFSRPGHVFPLKAKNGGVLRRTGHTEAAIDLARLAGMAPVGVIVEIMNEDGTMARLPQLLEIAKKFNLKIISIEDLISYRMETESLIERESETVIEDGDFKLIVYNQITTGEKHVAVTKGTWTAEDAVPVRVHNSRVKGDIFKDGHCLAGPHLHAALKQIEEMGKGAVVFMAKENASPKEYENYSQEMDTIDAFHQAKKMDPRDYGIGAQILRDLGIKKLQIMTNHPKKRTGIVGYGLEIAEYIPLKMQESQD